MNYCDYYSVDEYEVDQLYDDFGQALGETFFNYSEEEEELVKMGMLMFLSTVEELDPENIDPYKIDSPTISIEANLIHPSKDEDLLHAKDANEIVLATVGAVRPYVPTKNYSRVNFLQMPIISGLIWERIEECRDIIPIKSMPSLSLEEKFEDINWMNIFRLPVVTKGSDDTITSKIKKFLKKYLTASVTTKSKILWYNGDEGRASSFKVLNYDKQIVTIDCCYEDKEYMSLGKKNRNVPGVDFCTFSHYDYDIMVVSYCFFKHESRIMEIFNSLISKKKILIYITVSPDVTDKEIYHGKNAEQEQLWIPDANALRNGFAIITAVDDEKNVKTWTRHGRHIDRVWETRPGHYSQPLYELTQKYESNGIQHSAFKHFMFTIYDPLVQDRSSYYYPENFFLATMETGVLRHHDKVESQTLIMPDGEYLCTYQSEGKKTFIRFFDMNLDVPYVLRYRKLSLYTIPYQGKAGKQIDMMSTFTEVSYSLTVDKDYAFHPLVFYGYGYNYALDAIVYDAHKEGYLIFGVTKGDDNWFECDINEDGLFNVSEGGPFRVYLPQSYSVDKTDNGFYFDDERKCDTSVLHEDIRPPDKIQLVEI